MKIPITDILIRLRGDATHAAAPGRAPLAGQGAAHSALMNVIWRAWAALYSRPALYRAATWLATRLRALAPPLQSGWTHSRTPLKPARRTLHELLAAKKDDHGGHGERK